MTGARVRIPPSPPKRKAHARHGPSALHLDGRDSKGGKENAAVRHFPAPGSTGKRLRRAERKQTAARAENPSFSAKAEGPCKAWAFRFAFGWEGFEGRKENAAVRHFPAPGSMGKRLRRAERKQTADRAENPFFSAASGQALYRLFRLFSFHSQKPERAHAAAPPFPKRFRSVRLLACKRARDGSLSLPTFCGAGPGRPMQGMGLSLCIWMGGIRRAEEGTPQCGVPPPRGARARGCAARSGCGGMPRRGIFPP